MPRSCTPERAPSDISVELLDYGFGMATYVQDLKLVFQANDDREAAEFSRRLVDAAERGALEEIESETTLTPEAEPRRVD